MKSSMRIEVAGFQNGTPIPRRFTGDGANVSPRVSWDGIPANARELALIVEDPDAPNPIPFIHWAAFHIPAHAGVLPEGLPAADHTDRPVPLDQGRNDFGKVGYGGPAPPKGHGTHHYHFHLYALDDHLDLPPGTDAAELKRAIQGHILAEADYVGTYER